MTVGPIESTSLTLHQAKLSIRAVALLDSYGCCCCCCGYVGLDSGHLRGGAYLLCSGGFI